MSIETFDEFFASLPQKPAPLLRPLQLYEVQVPYEEATGIGLTLAEAVISCMMERVTMALVEMMVESYNECEVIVRYDYFHMRQLRNRPDIPEYTAKMQVFHRTVYIPVIEPF